MVYPVFKSSSYQENIFVSNFRQIVYKTNLNFHELNCLNHMFNRTIDVRQSVRSRWKLKNVKISDERKSVRKSDIERSSLTF